MDAKRLRHFREVVDDTASDGFSHIETTADDNSIHEMQAADNDDSQFVGSVPSRNVTQKRQKPFIQRPQSIEQDHELDSLVNFVNGQGQLPPIYLKRASTTKTMITTAAREPARNKPLVEATLGHTQVRTLMDTGAETNVIDQVCMNRIMRHDNQAVFKPFKSHLTCANGSRMLVAGEAELSLTLGNITSTQKFLVVPCLIPRVIVGIRTMKMLSVEIDPANDCIRVQNTSVPFVSKIDRPVAGNEQQSGLGIEH
jgi:predicted aspartyl protease